MFRSRSKHHRASAKTAEGVDGWVRITRFGGAYVVLCLMVSVAALNTGNNALFMVLALMLGALAVSGFASRSNVRALRLEVLPPGEVFARRPFRLAFQVHSESRFLAHWFLEIHFPGEGRPRLIPFLPRGGAGRGHVQFVVPRRGLYTLRRVSVASPFPFGLFEKARSYPVDLKILAYPELYEAGGRALPETGAAGEESHRRVGWGHDLHQLRPFRSGDDPRGIHWKQTAKTGKMIFTEHRAERSRRVSILVDNGVGALTGLEEQERFERLVSEAATAVVDLLERGFQVELVHRGRSIPFAAGTRHRYRLLEELALLEPSSRPPRETAAPLLAGDPQAPQWRFSLDRRERGAA